MFCFCFGKVFFLLGRRVAIHLILKFIVKPQHLQNCYLVLDRTNTELMWHDNYSIEYQQIRD